VSLDARAYGRMMGRGAGIPEAMTTVRAEGTRRKVFSHPLDQDRRNGAELLTVAEQRRLPDLADCGGPDQESIVQVVLTGPGRYRFLITALDERDEVLYGYVISGRGQEHDRWDRATYAELASRLVDAEGHPAIARDTSFSPQSVRECLAELELGEGGRAKTIFRRRASLPIKSHPDDLLLHDLRAR
jgi:hypothetical protein